MIRSSSFSDRVRSDVSGVASERTKWYLASSARDANNGLAVECFLRRLAEQIDHQADGRLLLRDVVLEERVNFFVAAVELRRRRDDDRLLFEG